jgi:cell division septal protein FtsQ
MVDERIAARRAEVRQDRRRRRLRRTILVATLLVLVAVGVVVERSSLVALAEVRVAGTERLDPRSVRRAADLELGTSTLRLPLGAARERVEALPLVERADVRRVDPLTVLVEVEERQPAAVVRHGDDTVLVDREGVVLATARAEDELVLRLASGTRVRFGRADQVAEKARALGAVLEDVGERSVAVIDVRAPSRPVVDPGTG